MTPEEVDAAIGNDRARIDALEAWQKQKQSELDAGKRVAVGVWQSVRPYVAAVLSKWPHAASALAGAAAAIGSLWGTGNLGTTTVDRPVERVVAPDSKQVARELVEALKSAAKEAK